MRYLVALVVVLPPVLLVIGAIRGRVTVRPCCEPAERDLRMADAFADGDADSASDPVRAGRAPE